MFRNVPECSVFLVLSTPIQNTKIDFIVSDHLRFYGCMKFSVLRIFRPFFFILTSIIHLSQLPDFSGSAILEIRNKEVFFVARN